MADLHLTALERFCVASLRYHRSRMVLPEGMVRGFLIQSGAYRPDARPDLIAYSPDGLIKLTVPVANLTQYPL